MANEEEMKVIEGGVCAAEGFTAGGIYCGIKDADESLDSSKKNDLGLIYCEKDCNTAAVYTTNKVKGAPLTVTKQHLEKSGGVSRAVIVNSKNANTCNPDGIEKAEKMGKLIADALSLDENKVLVASTGIIGQVLPIEPIEKGIPALINSLLKENHGEAASAIMTTDTVKKEYAVEFSMGGKRCKIGGMAKGSGMINPNMATTLNFITTDAAISQKMLQEALSEIVKVTYNCLSIDGDMSTNDMVILMASGLAGNDEVEAVGDDYEAFKGALYEVMVNLTKMLARDGEGASKLIECYCYGAPDYDTAITCAKAVIKSTLLKCAMFGEDANCGRILCALGYCDANFDVNSVDVYLRSENGEILVCENGCGIPFDEEKAAEILKSDEIQIRVNLKSGNEDATAWGCDMTYDYVKINGDYRT